MEIDFAQTPHSKFKAKPNGNGNGNDKNMSNMIPNIANYNSNNSKKNAIKNTSMKKNNNSFGPYKLGKTIGQGIKYSIAIIIDLTICIRTIW